MEPSRQSKSTLTILWNKAQLLDPATPTSTVESILRQAFEDDEDIVATLLEVRGRRFGAYAALLDETIRMKEELSASQEASRAARRKLDDEETSRVAGRTIGDAARSAMAAGCFRSTTLVIALAVTFVSLVGRLRRCDCPAGPPQASPPRRWHLRRGRTGIPSRGRKQER